MSFKQDRSDFFFFSNYLHSDALLPCNLKLFRGSERSVIRSSRLWGSCCVLVTVRSFPLLFRLPSSSDMSRVVILDLVQTAAHVRSDWMENSHSSWKACWLLHRLSFRSSWDQEQHVLTRPWTHPELHQTSNSGRWYPGDSWPVLSSLQGGISCPRGSFLLVNHTGTIRPRAF